MTAEEFKKAMRFEADRAIGASRQTTANLDDAITKIVKRAQLNGVDNTIIMETLNETIELVRVSE